MTRLNSEAALCAEDVSGLYTASTYADGGEEEDEDVNPFAPCKDASSSSSNTTTTTGLADVHTRKDSGAHGGNGTEKDAPTATIKRDTHEEVASVRESGTANAHDTDARREMMYAAWYARPFVCPMCASPSVRVASLAEQSSCHSSLSCSTYGSRAASQEDGNATTAYSKAGCHVPICESTAVTSAEEYAETSHRCDSSPSSESSAHSGRMCRFRMLDALLDHIEHAHAACGGVDALTPEQWNELYDTDAQPRRAVRREIARDERRRVRESVCATRCRTTMSRRKTRGDVVKPSEVSSLCAPDSLTPAGVHASDIMRHHAADAPHTPHTNVCNESVIDTVEDNKSNEGDGMRTTHVTAAMQPALLHEHVALEATLSSAENGQRRRTHDEAGELRTDTPHDSSCTSLTERNTTAASVQSTVHESKISVDGKNEELVRTTAALHGAVTVSDVDVHIRSPANTVLIGIVCDVRVGYVEEERVLQLVVRVSSVSGRRAEAAAAPWATRAEQAKVESQPRHRQRQCEAAEDDARREAEVGGCTGLAKPDTQITTSEMSSGAAKAGAVVDSAREQGNDNDNDNRHGHSLRQGADACAPPLTRLSRSREEECIEEEYIVVRCMGALLPFTMLKQQIRVGCCVYVHGCLCMNRHIDAVSHRSHAYPYVRVTFPLGGVKVI